MTPLPRFFSASIVSTVASLLIPAAHAQTNPISGTLGAQLILTKSCVISQGGATAGSFGMLDFGTQPGNFAGALSAQSLSVAGGSSTQIICSADVTSVNVTVDGGLHAGSGATVGTGTRALASATGAFVPYDVYSAATALAINRYVPGTAQAVLVTSLGAPFNLPVFGAINKTATTALPSGTYVDTLNVTLGW
ncbi:MAG: spore coat protein U domain-containing protein [Janthinobacterium lividum]